MFSLIIVIFSIALVVVLVLATLYFGGKSMAKGGAKAAATAILNQASQIASAGALAEASGKGWPVGNLVFSRDLLEVTPVPPTGAYIAGETPSAADWVYLDSTVHAFGLRAKLSKEVCFELNKLKGFHGIPMALQAGPTQMCFGPSEPYSYFHAAPSTSKSALDALVNSTVATATTELTATPVAAVTADSKDAAPAGPVSAASPGYPVLCASNNVIASGTCAGARPTGGGGTAPLPQPPVLRNNLVAAWPNVVTLNGAQLNDPSARWVEFCTTATAETVNMSSRAFIGDVPLNTLHMYQMHGGQCIIVGDVPAHSAGQVPIRMVTSGGKEYTGAITYATASAAPPQLFELTPRNGSSQTSTTVTIKGSGFLPNAQAFAYRMPIATKVLDSSTLQVIVPRATDLGLDISGGGAAYPQIYVTNGDSTESGQVTFEQARPPSITGIFPQTATPGESLMIVGAGLVHGTVFTINGTPVPVTEYVASQSTAATVPNLPPGSYVIEAKVPGYDAVASKVAFTVL